MPNMFPVKAKSGKTEAAGLFSFVPPRSLDVLRACAICGGRKANMDPKPSKANPNRMIYVHNYLPLLSKKHMAKFWPAARYQVFPTSDKSKRSAFAEKGAEIFDLEGKNFKALTGKDKDDSYVETLYRVLRNGFYTYFKDGAYITSDVGLAPLPDLGSILMNVTPDNPFPVDKNGLGVALFVDPQDKWVDKYAIRATYIVLYQAAGNFEGSVADDIEVTRIYMNNWFFTCCDMIEFDGVPYIKVTESAVKVPARYVKAKVSDVDENSLVGSFDRAIRKRSQKALTDKDVDDDEALMDIKGEASDLEKRMLEAAKNLRVLRELRDAYVAQNPLDRYVMDPTNFDFTSEYTSMFLEGMMTAVPVLITPLERLFLCSRSFIDAVTTLALVAGGSAINGGISSVFLNALQNTNECDCILLYSAQDGDKYTDPFSKYNPEGLVDSAIFFAPGKSQYLSEGSLAVFSRQSLKGRETLYYIVDQKKRVAYSKNWIFNIDNETMEYIPGICYSEVAEVGKKDAAKFTALTFANKNLDGTGKRATMIIPEVLSFDEK